MVFSTGRFQRFQAGWAIMFLLSLLATAPTAGKVSGSATGNGGATIGPAPDMGDETMQVKSYLSFEGRCEEALEFYKKAVGAEVKALMRFRENPDFQNGAPPEGCLGPGAEDKVMHSEFRIGETTLMATDGMNSGKANFAGTSQALLVASADEADRCFNALSEGGQVMMPLAKTFCSEKFGMTTDRFGVPWMIVVDRP